MRSLLTLSESPLEIAHAVVNAHPALLALDPAAAEIVAETIDAASGLRALATRISAQGPASPTGGWAIERPVGAVAGIPATSLVLSTETRESAAPVVSEVLAATQADPRLEGVLWFPHPAAAGGYRPVPPVPPAAWEVVAMPPRYGATVASVAFTPGGGPGTAGAFRLAAGNTAPRALSGYVEFLDAAGAPIPPTGWSSRLPPGVPASFETAARKYLGLLLPTRRIEGIAMPQGDLDFSFPQPAGTAVARLTWGGLGASPWDPLAGPAGAIVTAVLGYAVPAILAQAGIPPGGWYAGLYQNAPLVAQVVAAGAFLLGAPGAEDALRRVAEQIGPLLYGDPGLPLLTAELLKHMSAEQLTQGAAAIDWAASTLALTAAPGAAFAGSVLDAPAAFPLTVSAAMVGDLRIELWPDPQHGAWPATAARFALTAKWEGGEGSAAGPADGLTTAVPLAAPVAAVPANRAVAISVEVRDAAGQLRARGTATAPARTAGGEGPRTAPAVLTEERPALTADTRWAFSRTLAWDASRGHHWAAGPRPKATRADLNGGSTGHNLAALHGLAIDPAGRLLGYAWQASGQDLPFCGSPQPTSGQIDAFQTLGALSAPEDGLQFPSCGFSRPSRLLFGPAGAGLDFFLDPRLGAPRLRRFTPGRPFDMSLTAPSYGRFHSLRLDAAAIHPGGFAVGVLAAAGTFETLALGTGAAADSPGEPVAGRSGGTGTAPGRFAGPLALAVTAGGTVLVLEAGNRRIQAVDVWGNPVPYFPGGALLPLRQEAGAATYLDLAVDAQGHLFVLLYTGQGDRVADYRLDLYAPDGSFLGATPDCNAARLAVDPWRNVYTLDFASFNGPGGRTEPAVSLWTPHTA